MTTKDLETKLELKQLTHLDTAREVKDGYVCDLLSWVMAKGQEGMVWVTVQTHLNVIAVACLHDFSCVIVPEAISVPSQTLAKAEEEGIPVYSTSKTAYEVAVQLGNLGVGQ